ncbi:hypothetical protein [Ruthenibacterium lactatiformans]|nr:hypothetical protein [Ruthenibacterium lactatiformans]
MMTLLGFENLCFMMYDEPELWGRIFDEAGQRILKWLLLTTIWG